jgi:hypothetical protein
MTVAPESLQAGKLESGKARRPQPLVVPLKSELLHHYLIVPSVAFPLAFVKPPSCVIHE